jgi:beta-glucosidase
VVLKMNIRSLPIGVEAIGFPSRKPGLQLYPLCAVVLLLACADQKPTGFKPFQPPISYEDADKRAGSILKLLSAEEKILLIGGQSMFFTQGLQFHFADATQGVHIRKDPGGSLEKSTAFPSPIALAATWNTELAGKYATAIDEECRAGGISVLLGPGLNMYRTSQCGRNFEYFGEDPFLAARMVENYVVGAQSAGTITTLKHFLGNETDHRRRRTNSIVDDRTLHEIYLPAFKAGVDAGAMAVMTSCNQLNGSLPARAGQSSPICSATNWDSNGSS